MKPAKALQAALTAQKRKDLARWRTFTWRSQPFDVEDWFR